MAVAQWVRAFAPQAEGWVFESQPRKTKVIKTGSASSTDKHSAIGDGECHGSSDMTIINDAPCPSRCGTLRTLTAQRSWVPRIGQNLQPFIGNGDVFINYMSEKIWSGTKKKQPTKQNLGSSLLNYDRPALFISYSVEKEA